MWDKCKKGTSFSDCELAATDLFNTVRLFRFMWNGIVGANSATGLASRPIKVLLADEVDRYPGSAGTEGDPLSLAQKRQTTFWDTQQRAVTLGM